MLARMQVSAIGTYASADNDRRRGALQVSGSFTLGSRRKFGDDARNPIQAWRGIWPDERQFSRR